ncbi:hypothetical protein [Patulibacter defluvii]|uniref:hypothetical protein n=1 Tax=Patulibacter defluvii TaxID=3095358 RepID=UPI002A74F01D|nr:hypothetical protein [Patulibacter sp. DM4]
MSNSPTTIIDGTLHAVDPATWRLDRLAQPSVACLVAPEQRQSADRLAGRRVRVVGRGAFAPGRGEPHRITVERLVPLPDLPGLDAAAHAQTWTWPTLVAAQGTAPLDEPSALAVGIFDADRELEHFLASLRAA